MHIRPYVDLPDAYEELPSEHEPERPAPDLAPFARCGTDETAEMPAVPEAAAPARGGAVQGRAAFRDGAWGHAVADTGGGAEAAELPDVELTGAAAPSASSALSPLRRGSHRRDRRGEGRRRRRPAAVVLTAAGVVGALGAGVLTTQAFTGGSGGKSDDRSHSRDDRALSDLPAEPTGNNSDTRTEHRHKSHRPSPAPSRGAATSPASRADRDSDAHTRHGAGVPSTAASGGTGRTAGASSSGTGDSRGTATGSATSSGSQQNGHSPWYPGHHHSQSPRPSDQTLRAGDRGPEVAELQRRLKQAGALPQDAPEDGDYSAQVQDAVAQYQQSRGVQGDQYGEYGADTRQALESETTG